VFSKIYGDKQKGDTLYNYIQRAKSGFIKKSGSEMMGGQTYKIGTADIDLNTARGRYLIDMLQLSKKHPNLLKSLDIKQYFPKGKIITTTMYRQPTPYDIYGMRTSPLIKTAATTGETGFGLPTAEGLKSISSSANVFARLHYIKTGQFPSSDTPAGSFIQAAYAVEQSPIIQSSARINFIFEHQTLGQKILPSLTKIYNRIPGNIQTQFYKFNMGALPSSITASGLGYSAGIPSINLNIPSSGISGSSFVSTSAISPSPSIRSSSPSSISSSSMSSSISSISPSSSISSSISGSSGHSGISGSSISGSSSISSLSSMSSISSSSSSSSSSSISSSTTGGLIPFIPFAPLGVFGGGGAAGSYAAWGKYKKYREKKTIDPFAGVGDFGFKLKKPKDIWGF
jgi:hypothetical protein